MRVPFFVALFALSACDGGNFNVGGIDRDGDDYANDVDCDDADADRNPGMEELCNGIDDDCNDIVDDGLDLVTFYPDADGDGYGNPDPAGTVQACDGAKGFVQNAGDCDDTSNEVHPSATDVCNNIDDDCSGAIDDDLEQAPAWYVDADGDGFGVDGDDVVHSCDPQEGLASNAQDCDDTNPDMNPGADDICDELDNDCDGHADNDTTFKVKWFDDDDGDTYGDPLGFTFSCGQPEGYTDNDEDCDDQRAEAYPGAPDICNSKDDNCNGEVDEEPENFVMWYVDTDKDGYGAAETGHISCTAPDKQSSMKNGDCIDTNSKVFPGAVEKCNGLDDDCNTIVDDNATGSKTFYTDVDGDKYGVASSAVVACSAPVGSVEARGDCDDAVATIHPNAPEVCNDLDDDCDGNIDESAVDAPTWHFDDDADGFGSKTHIQVICDAPVGTIADGTDCDDTKNDVYPFAGDTSGDTIDSDCDGRDCQAAYDENDAYFVVCLEDQSWYAAAEWCDTHGYDGLATPQNETEQAFLLDLLVDTTKSATNAPWVGVNDETDEGIWRNADESEATYLPWSPGRPDGDALDNCAHFNWPLGVGTWNDASCDAQATWTAGTCELR